MNRINLNPSTEDIIAVWKASIELTAHFNEICMKVRALAFSILSAIVAASAYYFSKGGDEKFSLSPKEIIVFSLFSSIIWLGFYIMDRLWYHKLLRGCVKFTEGLESIYEFGSPNLGLAQSITQESRTLGIWRNSPARNRLDVFYGLGFFILFSPIINLLAVRNTPLLFAIICLAFYIFSVVAFKRKHGVFRGNFLELFAYVVIAPPALSTLIIGVVLCLKSAL